MAKSTEVTVRVADSEQVITRLNAQRQLLSGYLMLNAVLKELLGEALAALEEDYMEHHGEDMRHYHLIERICLALAD